MSNPGQEHWICIKRVFRYIKGTLNFSLKFVASRSKNVNLRAYADVDWAGDKISRRSTSGYVFQIGDSTVTWRSKRQFVIALSSTEAEYVSLCHAAQEAVWLRRFLNDLGFEQSRPTTLYDNNQDAIALTKNEKMNSRTKHINHLLDLVQECELLIANTHFQKKRGKLWTYISDMSGSKAQNDFILVNNKWKTR